VIATSERWSIGRIPWKRLSGEVAESLGEIVKKDFPNMSGNKNTKRMNMKGDHDHGSQNSYALFPNGGRKTTVMKEERREDHGEEGRESLRGGTS